MSVLLQTSLGTIAIDLYTKEAPAECTNFLKLCKAKYYTFAPIYNIQKGYVAEFGDPVYPLSKEGRSAWNLADDSKPKRFAVKKNKLKNNKKGVVAFSVQKDGIDGLATSIVTITLGDLDERRGLAEGVVFGQVTEGFDILEKINSAIVDRNYRPYQDIRIHHTYVLEDPFCEISGLEIPSTPEPTPVQLSTVRLDDLATVTADDDRELTDLELKEQRRRDAESKALTLEIMGDLPSAEVKPMENVLFVCKLNPVTQDDDLEIIFSRFGKIVSCEVVRDKDSGDSMQYAFVEYEDKRSCETAYLKMDGVLIDDRRIHVDFSQSVSKLADAWRDKTNEQSKFAYGSLRSSGDRDPRSIGDGDDRLKRAGGLKGYGPSDDRERTYSGNGRHHNVDRYHREDKYSRGNNTRSYRDRDEERGKAYKSSPRSSHGGYHRRDDHEPGRSSGSRGSTDSYRRERW